MDFTYNMDTINPFSAPVNDWVLYGDADIWGVAYML